MKRKIIDDEWIKILERIIRKKKLKIIIKKKRKGWGLKEKEMRIEEIIVWRKNENIIKEGNEKLNEFEGLLIKLIKNGKEDNRKKKKKEVMLRREKKGIEGRIGK